MSEERGERIIPVSIEDEMKTAYIDYSMSVIVSRALPDVRAVSYTHLTLPTISCG